MNGTALSMDDRKRFRNVTQLNIIEGKSLQLH